MSLSQYVTGMLATEEEVGKMLATLPEILREYPEAVDLVRHLRTTSRRHQGDLRRRLKASQEKEERRDVAGRSSLPDEPLEALTIAYGLLNQAALGYAILHAVAHRYYDGPQEGTTAELAEKHLRDYAEVIHSLNNAISEITIEALGIRGEECQCECPSCGLGICLCSPHGTNTIADIWRESACTPAKGMDGMRVRPPRRDSPAASAKLHSGDFIVAVDGQDVVDESWESIRTLQEGIRKHKPRGVVRLRIRRTSGGLDEVPLARQH